MKDVAAAWKHLYLTAYLIALHTYATLRVFGELLPNLIILRPEYFLEKEERFRIHASLLLLPIILFFLFICSLILLIRRCLLTDHICTTIIIIEILF